MDINYVTEFDTQPLKEKADKRKAMIVKMNGIFVSEAPKVN